MEVDGRRQQDVDALAAALERQQPPEPLDPRLVPRRGQRRRGRDVGRRLALVPALPADTRRARPTSRSAAIPRPARDAATRSRHPSADVPSAPGCSSSMRRQYADAMRALIFDVFGTCVDWRASIDRGGRALRAAGGVRGRVAGPVPAAAGDGPRRLAAVGEPRRAAPDRARHRAARLQRRAVRAGSRRAHEGVASARPVARRGRRPHRSQGRPHHRPLLERPHRPVGQSREVRRDCRGTRSSAPRSPAPTSPTRRSTSRASTRSASNRTRSAWSPPTTGISSAAQAVGLRTAFVPRPTEHGPDQTTDLAPEGDYDVVATDFWQSSLRPVSSVHIIATRDRAWTPDTLRALQRVTDARSRIFRSTTCCPSCWNA